ncbi:MAG: hemolysin family protein [Treponema sp.]|jgi:CBS domain containing-hemolysin-like protein|nr:hemolysin family protein [Treponema sp.]
MDYHTAGIIITLVFLLLLSAFFSASETGFSAASRIRLKNLAVKNRRAALALRLLEKYDRLLSTILIGNNIVNIAASALATMLFVGFLGNAGVSAATVVMTVLILVAGEISPKTLAKEAPEHAAMMTAPFLRLLVLILTPVNFLVSRWKKCIVRLFRVKGGAPVTEDELLTFVGEVRREGGINRQEEKMIRQAIEFDDVTAGEIYTPRIDVMAVPLDAPPDEIDRKFAETGFSRLPVYRDTIDNITGVILLKDFHHLVMKSGEQAASVVKPVLYINRAMKISKLLEILQKKKSHMAVLVDEFGGTLGIVTVEDIVEELVGEIWDEHDEVIEEIVLLGENRYRVLGRTGLEDFFAFFHVERGGEGKWNTTVGSWVIESLPGPPRAGDSFTSGDLRVTVAKVFRHRVMEVTVTRGEGHEKDQRPAAP